MPEVRVQLMKFRKKEAPIELEGIQATATRAIFAGNDSFPYIQFTFKQKYGPDLVVTLPLDQASKFTQQAINSISAATPRVPRPAGNQFFD